MRPSESWPPAFRLNQPLELEENCFVEFKEVSSKNPTRSITDTVVEYVVGFLNGSGGRILWGVRDHDRHVVGVRLNENDRDVIRRDTASKIGGIQPSIDPTSWDLHFHVVEEDGQQTDLSVVEVSVPRVSASDPYFTPANAVFVRINGVNQKLSGPAQTAWIRSRLENKMRHASTPVPSLLLSGLAQRIIRIFTEHGVEIAQIPRFLLVCRCPFASSFSDFLNETSILRWLDDDKIRWISELFLVRREWIDGEDDGIHARFWFDRNPSNVWSSIPDPLPREMDKPSVYFIRNGQKDEWLGDSRRGVFMIIEMPIAVLSQDRTICKYITDHTAHPWTYQRSHIQLRAWARLLDHHRGFHCYSRDVSSEVGLKISENSIFLRNVTEKHARLAADDWNLGDYARSANESVVAKEVDSLPQVIEFLSSHGFAGRGFS